MNTNDADLVNPVSDFFDVKRPPDGSVLKNNVDCDFAPASLGCVYCEGERVAGLSTSSVLLVWDLKVQTKIRILRRMRYSPLNEPKRRRLTQDEDSVK